MIEPCASIGLLAIQKLGRRLVTQRPALWAGTKSATVKMKSFLHIAAVLATVLTLGGCAVGWGDEASDGYADFTASARASPDAVQMTAIGRAVPSAPALAFATAPRRLTYIPRTAPILRGVAGSTCPYAQAALARLAT
jgi:hypothetical protein